MLLCDPHSQADLLVGADRMLTQWLTGKEQSQILIEYHMPGNKPGAFYAFSHKIFIATLQSTFRYLHFTDAKTEF